MIIYEYNINKNIKVINFKSINIYGPTKLTHTETETVWQCTP